MKLYPSMVKQGDSLLDVSKFVIYDWINFIALSEIILCLYIYIYIYIYMQ
jgi:hypothetical protein